MNETDGDGQPIDRPADAAESEAPWGPLRAFFNIRVGDHRGRLITDILAFDDATFAAQPDFAEWLFPLFTPNPSVPQAPVLTDDVLLALRSDALAQAQIAKSRDRALAFYRATSGWLSLVHPEHDRITRIIASLRLTTDFSVAGRFHDGVLQRMHESGRTVNARSQFLWRNARNGAIR